MNKAQAIEDVLSLCREPFYEGLLSDAESDVLPMLLEQRVVRRVYEGASGFLGLAKIVVVRA